MSATGSSLMSTIRAFWSNFACVRLWSRLDHPEIRPALYLSAAGEAMAITLGVSAIITTVGNPSVLAHNALKDRFGYSNFCVMFDTAPGSYFAAPMLSLVAYFIMQYVVADSLRSQLLLVDGRMTTFRYRLSTSANLLFGLSGLLLPVLLVFPPNQSFWIHVSIFMNFMICQWFCFLVNVLEDESLPVRIQAFLFAYTTITFSLTLMLIATAIDYDINHPPRQLVSPVILQILDYLWFVCQLMMVSSLPASPAIGVCYHVAIP